MKSMKCEKDMTPEVEPHPHSYPRSECVQYATGEEQKAINSPRKNEVSGPKQKQQSSMDVSGGKNKEWCYKEQHCIGTWNVKPMNQGQLDIVKQEMARLNTDILGISKNGWERAGLIQVTIIYYHRQKSHRRNGAVLVVKKKKKKNAVLGNNRKHNRIILCCFQRKPINSSGIQVYALNPDAEEAKVDQFCEDLPDHLELTP